jgi:hypothetical protein
VEAVSDLEAQRGKAISSGEFCCVAACSVSACTHASLPALAPTIISTLATPSYCIVVYALASRSDDARLCPLIA